MGHNALFHISYFSLVTHNAISLSKDMLQGSDKVHVAVSAYSRYYTASACLLPL